MGLLIIDLNIYTGEYKKALLTVHQVERMLLLLDQVAV